MEIYFRKSHDVSQYFVTLRGLMTPHTSKGLLFTPNTGVFNEISPSAQSILEEKLPHPPMPIVMT